MNALANQETGPEAERSLAWRAYQGPPPDGVIEQEMIERYLPLIRKVVERFRMSLPDQASADDLYSVGLTGLIAALRRYDPNRDRSFTGYAQTRIRGAILDYLRSQDWCSRRARSKSRQLKATLGALEQKLGRIPTDAEVAKELQITPAEYATLLDETRPIAFIPFDNQNTDSETGGLSLHETLQDPNDVTGPKRMEKQEMIELLTQRMAKLPDITRKVLSMYYFEDLRLAEIAEVFGLTESRICQIHTEAIIGLRAYLTRARER